MVTSRHRTDENARHATQTSGPVAIAIDLLGGFEVTVDGRPIDAAAWGRRHAAGIVKVLALAPGRRLHREQVLDALWPDDTLAEATPKLHKAAHYARRALGVPNAVVARGEQLALCPDHAVDVDAVRFEELARDALATGDRQAAASVLDLYDGELLPEDRYAEWAEEPRRRLRLAHLSVLRLAERWDDVLAIDPSDEAAHVAVMRRYAAAGDRHGALRQFERLDRQLRGELGVSPSREATMLRERLLAAELPSVDRRPDLVGRDRELETLHRLIDEVAAGANRTVFVEGPAGIGKSALLEQLAGTARTANFRVARGVAASVEGDWPYAVVIDALADLCRQHPTLLDGLADGHREELDRALSGAEYEWSGESTHQRLFVAVGELVRLASATSGLLISLDDVHEADDGSLRLLHYVGRSMHGQRVLLVVAHRPTTEHQTLIDTRASLVGRRGATELHLGPLGPDAARQLVQRVHDGIDTDTAGQVVDLAGGVPFALRELARRAAEEPGWTMALDVNLVAGVDPATRTALQRVAVIGTVFDTDEFVALSGLGEDDAFDALDRALAAGVVEPATDSGYRFRHALVREALLGDMPPHRRRAVHRDAAARLLASNASSARIGYHLMQAGRATEAVPYVLRAAETDAALGAYGDARALVESIRPHVGGPDRARALTLLGDILNALGDPMASSAYREALESAEPTEVKRLRARLARASVMSGDFDTAAAALDGLTPDGSEYDADILLARGNYAYFTADFDDAAAAAEAAQDLVLAGQYNWKVLDLVSLQGLLAHRSGKWFERMRLELRRTRTQPQFANAIFDGHLCATEYMLYGPTPYGEVIEVATDLKHTAQRSGALRAAAFAAALIGEAALLSGDLELADAQLTEARDLHHDLGSPAGEAVSLHRLGEVRMAQGLADAAVELQNSALPLARASMIANHLTQRVFGALITAAPDLIQARVMVDRAESTLGWDEVCPFCDVMFSVPATIACAKAGDIDHAHRHLRAAERSTELWRGTSWEAALDEARAHVAFASGDIAEATRLQESAAAGFERAGQPLDVARCRRPLATA